MEFGYKAQINVLFILLKSKVGAKRCKSKQKVGAKRCKSKQKVGAKRCKNIKKYKKIKKICYT